MSTKVQCDTEHVLLPYALLSCLILEGNRKGSSQGFTFVPPEKEGGGADAPRCINSFVSRVELKEKKKHRYVDHVF